jgi:hypothetical protein
MNKATKQEPGRSLRHDDLRCQCGQLIARWDERAIIIKCKRCRRYVTIAFDAIRGICPF